MYFAIENHDMSIVKTLLEGGFDPNHAITEYGFAAAYVAIMNHSPEILDVLILHGADVNYCSDRSTTLLQAAIQLFPLVPDISLRLVAVLTHENRVINPDVLGQSLQYACGMGYEAISRLLLHANADPNYFPYDDEFAMTPLVGMIFENEVHPEHAAIARLLLAHGADASHVSGERTVLQYAVEYGREDLIPILSSCSEMQEG